MADRDRLTELIEQAEGLKNNDFPSVEEIADYLLANGVIVPPCKVGDRVYSKMLVCPVDYEDIVDTANMMKGKSGLIIVQEPFLLDDELKEKCLRWVGWANKVDEREYSFFPELCDHPTEKGGGQNAR